MDKSKGATTKKNTSDFENLITWQDNPILDYYLSEEHWNFHVNQLLYKNLLIFHEGKELGAFLDVSRDRFAHPINDYTKLYGAMFNEAYRLCSCILSTPVPETKVAYFANQAATWKFRNFKDKNGNTFEILPNVIDLIESYHILGIVNAILSFANDQKDTVDRFLLALSVYKDKGLPFLSHIHSFESYNEVYRAFIVSTMISKSELRPGYDYNRKDEQLRNSIPLYKDFAEELDKKMKGTKVSMDQTVLDKISANNINYYYDGWRKGQVGAISQENGIYRFIELTRGSSGTPLRVHIQTEDNPIVAVGIVAYWLMFKRDKQLILKKLTKYTSIPETIKDMFDNYTQERYKQFKELNRDNPNSWDWDWDNQFYAKYIIPHEIKLNKQSEALFEYISDNDIKDIQSVMVNYINYLKKCRRERGYNVSPELLVLRAIDSGEETKLEDLEDYEVNTILDTLEEKGYIQVAWIEGHKPEAVRLLDKGRVYMKHLEEGSVAERTKPVVTSQQLAKENNTEEIPPQTQNSSVREITWVERKQCFKTAVLVVMEKRKADGDYLFENNSQWMAVYRFAIDLGIMYEVEDPRKPKDTSTPQYALFANFAHELQFDENPPTRLPFTKNAIDSINSKPNYARFNTSHPWSHEGISDPRSLEFFIEMDNVYLALEEEYNNLVSQAERVIK